MITAPRLVPTCCEHYQSAPPLVTTSSRLLRSYDAQYWRQDRVHGGVGQRTCAVLLVAIACHLHNTTLPENITLQSRCLLAVSTGRSVGKPVAAHRHNLTCGSLLFGYLLCKRTRPYPVTPLPNGLGYFQVKPSHVWIPQLFSNLVITHLLVYEDGTVTVFLKHRHIKFRRRGITQKKTYNKWTVVIQIHTFTTHEAQGGQRDTVREITVRAATTAQYSDL
jgi:hypothetical protein